MNHILLLITAFVTLMLTISVLALTHSEAVWFSQSTSEFTYPYIVNSTPSQPHVVFDQFDDDLLVDAAALVSVDDEYFLHVLKGQGNGNFNLTQTMSLSPLSPFDWQLSAADVNGDGAVDLITVNVDQDKGIYIWNAYLNTNGPEGFRCAGDVDANGETNVPDLLYLLEDWGCNSNSTR